MKIILDTNFILTCIKQKIDFIDDLSLFGELAIPIEAINELNKISEDKKQKKKDRDYAVLALKLLNKFKARIRIINLGDVNVDRGILNYAKNNEIIVATLDKELKQQLMGYAEIIVIKGKKKLELV